MKFRGKPCCLVANRKRRSNPLKVDPTRTSGLRRRLVAELRRRFAAIRSRIVQVLVTEDALGLNPPTSPFGLRVNNRWKWLPNPDKVKAFKEWLRQQLKGNVTGAKDEELWQRYINEGLQKGAGRAFDDVRAPERARGGGAKDKLDFYEGSKDEFLRSSFGRPVAVEKVKLLASRSFDDLEAVTAAMSTKIVRTLTDGLVQGKGPREIAREMTKTVDVSRGRAETIARTEIVRAHAEGQLLAMENLGVEEVGVAVEWSTAGDEKVCELCAPLEGVVLKISEAKGMLPRHPSCRCSWLPSGVGEDKPEQKRTQAEVKEAIDTSKTDKDDEWASGKKIAKDRPESILDKPDKEDRKKPEKAARAKSMDPDRQERERERLEAKLWKEAEREQKAAAKAAREEEKRLFMEEADKRMQRFREAEEAKREVERQRQQAEQEGRSLLEQIRARPESYQISKEEIARLSTVPPAEMKEHLRQTARPSGEVMSGAMREPEPMVHVEVAGVKFQWSKEAEVGAARTIAEEGKKIAALPPKLLDATNVISWTKQAHVHEVPGSDFTAVATASKGKTTVYKGGKLDAGSIAHEAGHNFADKKWGSPYPPESSDYGKAQKLEPPVTPYGATSAAEDFAEACQMYASKESRYDEPSLHDILKAKFPLKFKAIQELLE